MTVRSVLKGAGYLIGGYLILYYATGAGTVLTNGASASSQIIKSLQGRG